MSDKQKPGIGYAFLLNMSSIKVHSTWQETHNLFDGVTEPEIPDSIPGATRFSEK
jgi:hypothetical protein